MSREIKKLESTNQRIDKFKNYNHNFINDLIGKTISYKMSEWEVKDHIHHHVLLVMKNGWFQMVYAISVIEELEKNHQFEEISSTNPLQKIFEEHGVFIFNVGGNYIVGGVITNALGRNAAMLDEREVQSNMNNIDGEYSFGANISGFIYCHTFEKNENNAWGYELKFSDMEVGLEKQTWISKADVESYAFSKWKKEFNKEFKFPKEVLWHNNQLAEGETINMTFWNPNEKVIEENFDLKGPFAYRLRGPYFENDSKYYLIDKGLIKKKRTSKESGKAESGRASGWGYKWTLSKNATLKSWNEIRNDIYGIMVKEIEKTFKPTTQEKEDSAK